MNPVHRAIAGVIVATALLSGVALAQVRNESRPAHTAAYPTGFGVIDTIHVLRKGGSSFRIRIRLDNGDYQSFKEVNLAGLRVGDHIQIASGHLLQHMVSDEHYDSGGDPAQSG